MRVSDLVIPRSLRTINTPTENNNASMDGIRMRKFMIARIRAEIKSKKVTNIIAERTESRRRESRHRAEIEGLIRITAGQLSQVIPPHLDTIRSCHQRLRSKALPQFGHFIFCESPTHTMKLENQIRQVSSPQPHTLQGTQPEM
jgi:hypothetical protein